MNDIAGPGSISVVLAEDFNYYTGRSGGAIGDTTNTSTVSLDDEDTSWNESLWTNTLSDDVDVLEEAPAPTGKVNVGSFNGKLVVYALGLDGAKISWKVAGKWGVAYANGDTLNRFDRPVGASGVPVNVDIYVNGVKQLTKTVTTR